jgi:hypothetical protein
MSNLQQIKMLNATAFMEEIDVLVKQGHDYIDAVVVYCKNRNIEVETAATLVKMCTKLKANIESEAESLNLIPKQAKLPI